MPKYVAFLRAINVGGHVVKMDQLKKLFEKMGFTNVETFIASGNVIFDARNASEAKIEAALQDALGYEVRTFLRTPAQLARIAATKLDADGCGLWVGFLASTTKKDALNALATPTDAFHVDGTELYWACRLERFSDSTITGARLEKALAQKATLRNITTIRRIAAKHS
jgi:uncharacterized protein (DUF1697 family)